MDIFTEIQAGKYENKKPYNPPEDYLEKIDPENMTGKQVRETKERNDKRKKDYRDAYHAEEARVCQLFRDDVEQEEGTKDNPKANKLWELAWDRGHSSGLSDVYSYYVEMVDLIK